MLYIFWFLHQTTTILTLILILLSCISFDSYIKPQLDRREGAGVDVVYLLIPTSNHNYGDAVLWRSYVVYLLIPTSNHNPIGLVRFYRKVVYLLIPTSNHNNQDKLLTQIQVVYLLIPTSNHNTRTYVWDTTALYIFWFLHQTTTWHAFAYFLHSCISFDSYIKPQRWRDSPWVRLRCISFDSYIKPQLCLLWYLSQVVVYLLIPTSNHNSRKNDSGWLRLYIFWFLHQTTTTFSFPKRNECCISFDSYIKPQHVDWYST